MSNHVSEPADLHPIDQLAPLLAGELTLAELRTLVVHVRQCPVCQAELVEVAAGYGALQGIAREGLDDLAEPPPLAVRPIEIAPVRAVEDAPGDREAGPSASGARPRSAGARAFAAVAAVAAAVVLVLGGVVVGTRIDGEQQIAGPTTSIPPTTEAPDATATLEPEGPIDATGTVAMFEVDGGAEQLMSVDVSQLPPAGPGTFYEVWLLQPDTKQMFAVGVLPDSNSATFAIPADIVANYQAVDVSLQPDDGSVVHSGNSVLRATYA